MYTNDIIFEQEIKLHCFLGMVMLVEFNEPYSYVCIT